MPQRKKLFWVIVLLCGIPVIRLYSGNALRVENGYSTQFFPKISGFLRTLFGWLPFSIGDIGYGAVVVYLVFVLYRLIKFLIRKRKDDLRPKLIKGSLSVLMLCTIIYIVFNIFWGINYNRIGIAGQLGLDIKKYSVEELKTVNGLLVQKINISKQTLLHNNTKYPGDKQLFAMTADAYAAVAKKYSFLSYRRVSLKPSIWGWIGNFTGFLGYYNPFTGEAQVNTTVPKFTQPFTACHETAHQLGYAKEMEANFVGYLAAAASTDTVFHYSVYTDLFSYANRTLYFADSSAALQFRKMLLPEVVADFKERREFNLAHTSFLEPVFRAVYGVFLQSNQQPMGILSYDEVTGFIVAYYKKYGRI